MKHYNQAKRRLNVALTIGFYTIALAAGVLIAWLISLVALDIAPLLNRFR